MEMRGRDGNGQVGEEWSRRARHESVSLVS